MFLAASNASFSASLLVTSEFKVFNSALYALIFCLLVLISDWNALIFLSFSSIKAVIRSTSAFAYFRACSSSALSLVAFASSSFFWTNNAFLSAFSWSSSLVKESFWCFCDDKVPCSCKTTWALSFTFFSGVWSTWFCEVVSFSSFSFLLFFALFNASSELFYWYSAPCNAASVEITVEFLPSTSFSKSVLIVGCTCWVVSNATWIL